MEEEKTEMTDKQIRSMMISRFYSDWTAATDVVNQGWWNLICSVRDLRLWSKGIKAHRRWQVTPVKQYFNIKGNKESLVVQILAIQNFCEELLNGEEYARDAVFRIAQTISEDELP